MPVFKFRDVGEMNRRPGREPGDPSLYRAIRLLLDIGRRTRPRRFPPGLYKHRSIEALNAQTERWRATMYTRVGPGRKPPGARGRRTPGEDRHGDTERPRRGLPRRRDEL